MPKKAKQEMIKFVTSVRWDFCASCKKVVDEFELKCGWCGCEITAKDLGNKDTKI